MLPKNRLGFFARGSMLALCFFLVSQANSQEYQSTLDSLENIYITKNFSKANELKILRQILKRSENPQKNLYYSDILIEKASKVDSTNYLFDGYLQRGNAYRMSSDLSKALESFLKASDIAKDSKNKINLAISKISIGDVYSEIGSHESSISYYEDGINMLRDTKSDSTYLATALLNFGDEYFNVGKYDKAMSLFYESSAICKNINFKLGTAYNLGNMGMVYARQNKPVRAEDYINEAIKILEEEKDYYPISVYLSYISDIYLDSNKPLLALDYSERSLSLAKKYQLKNEISEANLQLSAIHEQLNNPAKSLFYIKKHIKFKDSLYLNLQKIAESTTEIEVSKKQIEVDLLNEKSKNEKVITYTFFGGFVLVSLLAFGLYRRNKFINKTKKVIETEREKADKLLLNILPIETANELKKYGKVEAKKYQSVTVLFTDFKGFTKFAEEAQPEKLVESIDMYFSEFDQIIEKYKLEKIKTIGDSYMCVGGLPQQNDSHAFDMAQAAAEMAFYVKKMKLVHNVSDIRFDVRIGIHTGPVVAGVVGIKKFTYDIWGDTVNIASRLETACEIGKINISETTYQLIKDKGKFSFESRGEVSVKNRSPIKMYFMSELE